MKGRNVKLGNGDDMQGKGIGCDLVPIGRLNVDGQIGFETVSV